MSSWLNIHGAFTYQDTSTECVLDMPQLAKLCGFDENLERCMGGVLNDTPLEMRDIGSGAILKALTWAHEEGVYAFNPLTDSNATLLVGEKYRYRLPVLVPRPYGSEGFGDIDVTLAKDMDGSVFPLDNWENTSIAVSVVCRMDLRDRDKTDMPYTRLWWNLLNVWTVVRTYGLSMCTWDYEEQLETIWFDTCDDSPKAVDLLEYFFEVCAAYDALPAKGGNGLREKSFQEWYNHTWVPEHGEGPVVAGPGRSLVDLPDKSETKNK